MKKMRYPIKKNAIVLIITLVIIVLVSLSGCIDMLSQVNTPPRRPAIPNCKYFLGYTHETYTFYTFSTDPDSAGSKIEFYWEWGDGTNTGWISDAHASHSWESPDIYEVRVKARDDQGAESEWSISNPFKAIVKPEVGPDVPQKRSDSEWTEWQQNPWKDEPNETPGFEFILLIFSFLVIIMILYLKKKT